MGIVKISDTMHENLRVASQALSRSINAQAEHWMRVGMLAELHPGLDHQAIARLLVQAEATGGLDLAAALALAPQAAAAAAGPATAPVRLADVAGAHTPGGAH
ncbi:MAG: hypothetical protein RLY78_2259 [Pseudomonadota bacterium]|jgi:hypothetical protein|uniref:ParD-like family protein n=1 Tax=Pseudaquabacterium rugosum TaxID=2984194 RepID=A0ABU9BDI3_9BURK